MRRVVLASVHAERSVAFVQGGSPEPLGADLGTDLVELIIADTELGLEGVFGPGAVIPAQSAVRAAAYAVLPETPSAEDYTFAGNMIAVDVDAPTVTTALSALARELEADAAAVVRHEWWVARERLEFGVSVSVWDRLTLLVVGRDGRVLWRDVATTRVVASPVSVGSLGSIPFGLRGRLWGEDFRRQGRQAARDGWRLLRLRYEQQRPKATAQPLPALLPAIVSEPPPPLEAAVPTP